MLAQVLEPEWRWCSADWASYDFENADGVGLEIKQSAALQSWHTPGAKTNQGRFDIAERTGRYEGLEWIAEPGRAAAIYVFAWHPVIDHDAADHREPEQWQFFPVKASDLPRQKTIALSRIAKLSEPASIEQIAAAVRSLANQPPDHDATPDC